MAAAASHPQEPSGGDWEQFLQWNRPLPARIESCVHYQIEHQAAVRARKVAITWSGGELSYSDLDRIATQVAFMLHRRGVGPDVIVPLCFDHSPWMIIATLGVLKAGGAFLAIDPKSPSSRTRTMLDQIDAKVVISSPSYRHLFNDFGMDVVQLSDDQQSILPNVKDWKPARFSPKSAAYSIFTSGSTGKPKGVVVEHESLCSGMAFHAPALLINEHSRVLQFASYTHDASVVEVITTLCMGGTICLPSETQRTNGLAEFINEKAINWAVLTPSFIATIEPSEVPTLKVVVLAGERLSQSNIDGWATSVRLLSSYGVSECSVVTTISSPADKGRSPANVGMPAGGICWIVDPADTDRLLPIGAVGELLIEGPTVARGYIKNPEATSKAFIGPPSWLWPLLAKEDRTRRLYRTGDLVRQEPDGSLEFISRIDSQVKVAGRRIELGEVEHHISTHPDVKLCMVLYPQTGNYAKQLVAVVELHKKTHGMQAGELVESLSETQKIARATGTKAPKYMIPPFWFIVDQFPRLPSAKLDRRKVGEWLEKRQSGRSIIDSGDVIPPGNTIAREIALQIASLRPPQESTDSTTSLRNTPLREAGVDSIRAITLMKSLNRRYGVRIPVAYFMDEAATPTSIAEHIQRSQTLGQNDYIPVPQIDLVSEFDRLEKLLDRKLLKAPQRSRSAPTGSPVVLLTGAGGYLGSDILRQLLAARVKVVALVRTSSIASGRKRLVDRAAASGWWSSTYEDHLEIWRGDLSKKNLGLQAPLLARLSGHESEEESIHAIIHNGARVHWSESAKNLWPVNVDATLQLLEAALGSPWIRKFVFVSGGAPLAGSIQQQLEAARDGYSQTKLLSQGLVQHCAKYISDKVELEISALKPGFIIGAPDGGVANTSDYLWRYISTAIELGAYDESTDKSLVTFSTLPLVSGAIVRRALSSYPKKQRLRVFESGLHEKAIWEVVQEFGYKLRPVNHQTWVTKLQDVLDARRENHILWPLQTTLEQLDYRLGQPQGGPPSEGQMERHLRNAVRQNLGSLVQIKFIQAPYHDDTMDVSTAQSFSRLVANAERALTLDNYTQSDKLEANSELPAVMLSNADIERLGRQRPAFFTTASVEVGFVVTVIASMAMSEFFISGFNVVLPSLAVSMGIPEASRTWPSAVLTLTTAALLLPCARLCDMYGSRLIFLLGHAWVVAWSVGGGFAPNLATLIVCRALQGAGAAAFLPAGLALLGRVYRPGPRKNLVFGLYGVMAGVGFFSGILVGAFAAQWLGWRWYFWVGAILVAINAAVAFVSIPRQLNDTDSSASMDWWGFVTIVPGLVLVVFALTDAGNAQQGWRTPYIIVTVILGGLLLGAAVYVEGWAAAQPLLPAELFRPKYMTRLIVAIFCSYGVFGLFMFYVTYYIETVLNITPLLTAAWLSPLAIGGFVLALVGGFVLHLIPGRILIIISGLGYLVSVLLFALIPEQRTSTTGEQSPSSSFLYWAYIFPAMVCCTIGIDVTFNVSNIFITTSLPDRLQATAGAVINSVLYLGMAFWLGVGQLAISTTVEHRGGSANVSLRDQYKIGFWTGVGLATVALCLTATVKMGSAAAEMTVDEKGEFQKDDTDSIDS